MGGVYWEEQQIRAKAWRIVIIVVVGIGIAGLGMLLAGARRTARRGANARREPHLLQPHGTTDVVADAPALHDISTICEIRYPVMIVLGAVLLVAGFLLGIHLLVTVGIIVLVIGLVLMVAGRTGHAIGGRRHYY